MAPYQTSFRAALLDPTVPPPAGLTDGSGAPTAKRFEVYRNNVTVALVNALRTGFPVIHKLLGGENFDRLAPIYIRAHPPRSPLMMHYGQDMPAFLAEFGPLQHLGYLPDVARLELALRASYHAADAAALDPQRLIDCAPDDLLAATLTFAPAVRLLRSAWPLYDIWRYNSEADAPKPSAVAQAVLITRAEFDPQPHLITAAQYAWLHACQSGATLSEAQDRAEDESFDLSPLIALLLQTRALSSLKLPKD